MIIIVYQAMQNENLLRITIPKQMCEALKLKASDILSLSVTDHEMQAKKQVELLLDAEATHISQLLMWVWVWVHNFIPTHTFNIQNYQ